MAASALSKQGLVIGLCAAFFGLMLVPTSAQPVSDEAMAAARELMIATRATDQFRALLPNVIRAIKPAVVQNRPDVEKDFDAIVPVLIQGMNARVEELTNELALIYANNFTPDEMHEIIGFYHTPAGERFVEKMPVIAQQSLPVGQAWGQKIATELQGQIAEELRKRGH